MIKVTTLITALLLSTSTLLAGDYNVDKSHTDVGFKIKHMMVSNVKGSFSDFQGSFSYDEKSRVLTSLHGVVKAASIDTRDKKRDNHLRSEDFFDVTKFPDITLNMISHKGDMVSTNFTLHGITKKVNFEIEVGGDVRDPWGNHRAGFTLLGKINRKDFGLTWNKMLDAGGIAVGDTVKLIIEVEGIETK